MLLRTTLKSRTRPALAGEPALRRRERAGWQVLGRVTSTLRASAVRLFHGAASCVSLAMVLLWASNVFGVCATISNLSVTTSRCQDIEISWQLTVFSPPPRAASAIYRGATPSFDDATIYRVNPTSPFVDNQVQPGVPYYYWVVYGGINDVPYGVGGCASTEPAMGVRIGPDAPTNVTASYGTRCDGVLVSWAGTPLANTYQVWRNTVNNAASASLVSASAAVPFLDQDPAIIGVPVYYFVRALNQQNQCPSAFSTNAALGYRGALAAPSSIAATDGVYCGRVRVSWTAVLGRSSYEVWRSPTELLGSAVRVATPTSESIDDVPPVSGQSYFYWVRAVNACGPGPFSAAGEPGSRNATAPVPQGLMASDRSSCLGVQLAWSPPADTTEVDGFDVLRSEQPAPTSAIVVGNPVLPAFSDESALPELTYYYWVRSRGPCGTSPRSIPDAGTRRGTVPTFHSHPSSVALDEGQNATFVAGASGFGAISYQWYRNGVPLSNGGRVAGATLPSLSISGVLPADEGWYQVRVADSCAAVFSQYARLELVNRVVYDNLGTNVFSENFTPAEAEVGDLVELSPAGARVALNRVEVRLSRSGPFSGNLTLAVYDGAPSNGEPPLVTSTLASPSVGTGNGSVFAFAFPQNHIVPGRITLGVRSTTGWDRLNAFWGDTPSVGSSEQFFFTRTATGWQQRTWSGGQPANMAIRVIGRVIHCAGDLDDGSGEGRPDGGVTIEDLVYFLAQFGLGDARVDLDDGSGAGIPDGGVTVEDLIYFLARFEGGC